MTFVFKLKVSLEVELNTKALPTLIAGKGFLLFLSHRLVGCIHHDSGRRFFDLLQGVFK
jgi:hypothetical protein